MIGVALAGVAGGVLSGLLGVGGGILFVPALALFAGLTQIRAEATSLLAIIPVALVGAWRQRAYGNLRLADAGILGVLSGGGVLGGVAAANAIPERALQVGFAILLVGTAAQLARRGWRQRSDRLRGEDDR